MSKRETIVACRLGQAAYVPTWQLQKRLQARLVAAKRMDPPVPLDHVMLMVEHPHVYTLGKSGDRANLLATEAELVAAGATFEHVDRGGDITYHGPGQLVVYPILDLDRFFTDIHRYLRELEEAVILTCMDFGVPAGRVPGRTGVWILDGENSARKICAMGVRCSRWVTMHGIGFNVNTELDNYGRIVPCGIADADVTSLARETGRVIDMSTVEDLFVERMAARFSADIRLMDRTATIGFLESYLGDVPFPVTDTQDANGLR